MRLGRLSSLGWLCAALALTFTASADAQELTRARLLTELDAATFNDHFPAVALATGVSGRVTLACNVAADGASTCEAAEETPAAMGFGAAAVTMSRGWTFAPRQENGQPVASVLRVNIAFENEVPSRQPLQGTLYVDARRDGADSGPGTLDAENLEYLRCSWSGNMCNSPQTGSDVEFQNTSYYPPEARAAGLEGRALVACAVRAASRIECSLESEAPDGSSFGAQALRLVTETAERLELPTGAVFRVPVQFSLHRGARIERASAWDSIPDGEDFMRAFPSRALEQEVSGRAVLICEIRADRRLDCTVLGEGPEGYGFGNAALRLYSRFRLSPEMFGTPGYTVGERIRMPLTFLVR